MAVSVKFTGLTSLRGVLLGWPARMGELMRPDVIRITREAAAQLVSAYPRGDTGNLRAGVKTKFQTTPTGTKGTVLSTAPHAHLWEYGTVNRRTQKGWNRGRMLTQIHRGLTAINARQQRALRAIAIDRLREDGFKVTVDG